MHINPRSFADRVKLGDQAAAGNDLPGAVVEYRAALQIKSDKVTSKKLEKIAHSIKGTN